MEKSDDDLIGECLAGDDRGFEQLTHRYLGPVYGFLARLMGDQDDASDAAQDAFVKAWQKLRSFKRGKSFKTWIFAIARNAAIDIMRKRRHAVFSDFDREDGANTFVDTLADAEPLPDAVFERAADAAMLEGALAKLPAPAREVLTLRYQEGLAFEEIGDIVHEPLNTVKSRHRRALIALRSILKAPGEGSVS